MSYFILTRPVEPGNILADFKPDDLNVSFVTGAKITEKLPNPIELTWDPENEKGARVSFYEAAPGTLMAKDLVSALQSAGVDNLDTYPVVIHSESGHPDCHDYLAVNIIGVLATADMEQSEYEEGEFFDGFFDVTFYSIVIDEEKAKGQLLYRMAETVSTVVIHEKIVDVLKEKGSFGLTFDLPEDTLT